MTEPSHSFYRPAAHHTGIWSTICLPLLLGTALLLVDVYFIPGIFALPTLLLVLLVYLGMRLPPQIVALWAIFYAGVIMLITFLQVGDSVTNPIYRPYIRPAIFLAGSAGTILLAGYRQRLQAGHEALFRIISALPLAVIISDISGNILLLNEQARQVLKNHIIPASRLSYFSMFLDPDDHGKTIAEYIGYFDPSHVGTVTRMLRTRGEPALILHSSITTVVVDGHRYAITMVERVEHTADEPVSFAR